MLCALYMYICNHYMILNLAEIKILRISDKFCI